MLGHASRPQNSSPSTVSVGTPKAPSAMALAVWARTRSFASSSRAARTIASPSRPTSRATSATTAASVTPRPPPQVSR